MSLLLTPTPASLSDPEPHYEFPDLLTISYGADVACPLIVIQIALSYGSLETQLGQQHLQEMSLAHTPARAGKRFERS